MDSKNKKLLKKVVNLPNLLTASRIVLAIIFFGLMVLGHLKKQAGYNYYFVSLWIFVIAGVTDLLDGYFARKYDMHTVLGRIIDPFADKLMICGTFVVVLSIDRRLVDVWLVLLVLGREFVVSAIRTVAESYRIPFGAIGVGKIKMAIQFAAGIAFILALYLKGYHGANPNDSSAYAAVIEFLYRLWYKAGVPVTASMYCVTMLVTGISGIVYLTRGVHALKAIESGEHES